jgi:hypothetical protein
MFRFTIRDVLWLMVVVGLAIGWWVDHRATDSRLRQSHRDNLELQYRLRELSAKMFGG